MGETATYALYVDWNGDGDFGDTGEDISSDWMSATINRGFASPLARVASVGTATFVLKNSSQSYSPPLEADVLPRREVKFDMTYGGSTETLFRGFIEAIRPTYGSNLERRCVLECVDAMALLDLAEGEIALQSNVYADDIISAVVSAVYTPPSTDYQSGITLFTTSNEGWAYQEEQVERVGASQKILEACTSDWGRFFIAGDGEATFYNRNQMPQDSSTELTLNDDMLGMAYQSAVGTVFNYIEATCYPRTVGTEYEVLGRLSQGVAPSIEASGEQIFVIRFRDPVDQTVRIGGKDCLTPVATTDYEITDDEAGEGTDETANVTPSATFYGDHAEITITNDVAYNVYVQKLQVRGYPVRAREKVGVIASDATSISDYQKRKLAIQAALISDIPTAQGLANYLLSYYKDPLTDIKAVEIIANKDATWMAAVRDLELMDKVEITESQTGLSSQEAFIYRMTHQINSAHEHRLIFDLESAYSLGGTPFRVEVSTFDSGHILVY